MTGYRHLLLAHFVCRKLFFSLTDLDEGNTSYYVKQTCDNDLITALVINPLHIMKQHSHSVLIDLHRTRNSQ